MILAGVQFPFSKSTVFRVVALGFAYWLSVILAVQLVYPVTKTALFWPANAITIAALLLSSRKHWPLYLCVTALAYLAAVIPLKPSGLFPLFTYLVFCVANLVEIFIVSILVTRFVPGPVTYKNLPKILQAIILASIPAIAVGTSISSIAVVRAFEEATFFSAWIAWFVGNLSGLLLVLPALLVWLTPGAPSVKSYTKNEIIERTGIAAIFIAMGMFFATYLSVGSQINLVFLYLLFPLLIWTAIRLGLRSTTATVLAVGLFVITMTYLGQGPFNFENLSAFSQILLMKFSLITVAATTILLAAVGTERKILEAQSSAQATLLNATIDSMEHGCAVYDSEMHLILYNAHFENLFEFPPGFLFPGISYRDLIKFRAERGDYGPGGVEETIDKRLENAKNFAVDRLGEHTLASGTTYIYHREPMAGGGRVTTFTDITERKRLEAELLAQATLLNATIDSMDHGCAVYDSGQNLVRYNAHFEKLFEFPPGFLFPGISQREMVRFRAERGDHGPGDIEETINKRIAVVATFKDARSGERTLPTGTTYIYHREPMPGGGRVTTYTDITEHKQLEVHFAGAQKMEALGKMTGGVAHEFNNLLMAVTGNLQLLQNKLEGQEDLTRLASNSLKAAFRGAELTHQLLSYTGQQKLSPKVTDISAFTSEIVDLLRSALGEGVELETALADDIWPVAVDQGQFQQAMLNLSINARDAMPAGGKLTIETANVHLDAAYAATRSFKVNLGDYVRVSVTDTGTGMPPEVLEKVFDPFFTTKGRAKGTGLGMSMVYGFIKRQSGGHIDIDSAVGRGTTVHLYLPCAEVVEEEPAEVENESEQRIEGRGTVLVVEDSPHVRELICDDVLSGLGYTAHCVEDGPAALAHLERFGPVDLLLTDVLLPKDMNGTELARRVQKITPATKVILMTGYSVDTLEGRGLSVSGYLLLHKPFPVAELTRVIAEALNGRDD